MDGFEEFAAQHTDALLRTAVLIVWDDQEAEDLVQETLWRVARRWSKIGSMKMPLAYARRILVNLATDGAPARGRRRQELVASESTPEIGVDPVTEIHERAEVLDALAALPTRARAVLVLRFYHDLSEARIADILGCSTGTVKSTASRGLAHLRQNFEANNSRSTNQTIRGEA